MKKVVELPVCADSAECNYKIHGMFGNPDRCTARQVGTTKDKVYCKAQRFPNAREKVEFT